jgi:glycosyltransferase involved in cell wall biosynthesis
VLTHEQVEIVPFTSRQRFVLSCVVPVFNEQGVIGRFLQTLHDAAGDITPNINIVVVNDGSTDGSAQEVLQVADKLSVHYIELSRNFGKELAIQAGLDVARGDCAIILDADFQHPVELIAEMVARWKTGVDMVYGVKARDRESRFKRAASRAFYRFIAGDERVQIPRDGGDFRLLDRKVIDVLKALPERTRFMKGLYAWVGFKSEAIEFQPAERSGGKSKFSVLKLAALALTGITAFSNVPLRALLVVGLTIAALSGLTGCWIVFEALFMGQPIPGFTTLAASILFLSGVQLMAIGIVGEYVGRVFEESKRRPLYVVARSMPNREVESAAAVLPGPRAAQR